MITVPGEGRTHDFIQICREFYMNYVLDPASYHLRPPRGLSMSKYEIGQARAAGQDPVDTMLDAPHMIVRAVSRLYLFACKFASLLKCACLSVESGV